MEEIKTELLAPAGGWEALRAAVQNGADAVYLGSERFGARQAAQNFDRDNLARAIDYCHSRAVAVYLTVNTLISDRETEDFSELIKFARREGIDAFIVGDMGAASLIKHNAADVAMHASTQMTIHNTLGAKAIKDLGFSRVVLARELNKDDIFDITKNTDIQTEVFVHGALCMCYSGQCLMSSIFGGRSGNRGMCAQPCRLPYTLNKDRRAVANGYLLSPKDLCLVEHINVLQSMGVASLKIEGRMKGPNYVAAVVSIYRRILDGESITDIDKNMLNNAFSRGFTTGFFTGQTGRAYMSVENGFDDIYKKQDVNLLNTLKDTWNENANSKKLKVTAIFKLQNNKPASLELKYSNDINVNVMGKIMPQIAQTGPLTEGKIENQLLKAGQYPVEITNLKIELEKGLFLPVSELNELRRSAYNEITAKIAESYKRTDKPISYPRLSQASKEGKGIFSVKVQNIEQLNAIVRYSPQRLYAPADLVYKNKLNKIIEGTEIIPYFPTIIKNAHIDVYKPMLTDFKQRGFNIIEAGNLGLATLANGMGFGVWLSNAFNIFNKYSADFYAKMGFVGAEASRELNLGQIKDLIKCSPLQIETAVYGKFELMTTQNCIISSANTCECENGSYELTDRKGQRLPVLTQKPLCQSIILNSKALYMADRLDELKNLGIYFLKLIFTVENSLQCDRIYSMYQKGDAIIPQNLEYTRGHYYRGV